MKNHLSTLYGFEDVYIMRLISLHYRLEKWADIQ
jgi:hypothetical protein